MRYPSYGGTQKKNEKKLVAYSGRFPLSAAWPAGERGGCVRWRRWTAGRTRPTFLPISFWVENQQVVSLLAMQTAAAVAIIVTLSSLKHIRIFYQLVLIAWFEFNGVFFFLLSTLNIYISFMTICRPDMTVAVDWALKTNQLRIYLSWY